MTMWMVRAEAGGALFQKFLDEGVVAIGWSDIGSLENETERASIFAKVSDKWPDWKPRKQGKATGCLYRFRNEFQVGDHVVTYDPSQRVYAIGKISGDYRFDPNFDPEYGDHNVRPVEWLGRVNRDELAVQTKNSLGNIGTLFRLPPEAEKNILAALSGSSERDETEEEVEEELLLEELEEKSKEFVKDQVMSLDWDELQELVAGLLRSMGYKTRISPAGPDRGKDIVASPDGLGFEDPRIVVEVKHRVQQMGSREIRSFVGGRHPTDKGLYVSTGGFSKEARYEAERANIPITLVDIDDFVKLIIENYEKMDIECQRLLPLRRFYWPI